LTFNDLAAAPLVAALTEARRASRPVGGRSVLVRWRSLLSVGIRRPSFACPSTASAVFTADPRSLPRVRDER